MTLRDGTRQPGQHRTGNCRYRLDTDPIWTVQGIVPLNHPMVAAASSRTTASNALQSGLQVIVTGWNRDELSTPHPLCRLVNGGQ